MEAPLPASATTQPEEKKPKPSSLVSGVAWLGIIAGALGVLAAGAFFGLREVIQILVAQVSANFGVTEWGGSLGFALTHPLVTSILLGLGSLIFLVASVELLRRKNWARWFTIATMVADMVSELSEMGTNVVQALRGPQRPMAGGMQLNLQLQALGPMMNLFGFMFTGLFLAFNAWVVWKFVTEPIAAEFKPRPPAA